MSQVTCPGEVVTSVTGEPICQDLGGAPLAWIASPAFSIDALDPLMMSGAFAAGFFVVGMGWVISAGIRFALSLLK